MSRAVLRKSCVAVLNHLHVDKCKSAQLRMTVLFVWKSCPSAKPGNVKPLDGCQKWMGFGADLEGKCPVPGECELDKCFSIGAWVARGPRGDMVP